MIVVIASPLDVHARQVVAALDGSGHEACILDTGEFGKGALLSYASAAPAEAVAADGRRIPFDQVSAVWNRRPRHAQIAAGVRDPALRQFSRQEWLNLLDGIFINSTATFVNPLWAEYAAVKPRQLHVAQSVGLAVPDTLITSDPGRAEAFIARHEGRVIHKAMTAPKDRLIDTRQWQETDRPALARLPLAPTIFQEAIPGPADLRVTFVGGELFAARILTSEGGAGIDSRMDLDAPCESCELAAGDRERLLAFMQRMGLVYGTIDLKVRADGSCVFFEVNPQGQFLYIEILTGLPITQAMANLLSRGGPGP